MNIIRKTDEPSGSTNAGGHLIFRLLPYWPLFILLFVLSIVGAWVYLQITPQLFGAEAKILINERKGADESGSQDPMSSTLPKKKSVDNEREVIVSSPIINQVVTDFSLYASVYKKSFLSNRVMYDDSPIKIVALDPKGIKPTKANVDFTCTSSGIILGNKKYAFGKWHQMSYGTLMFRRNENTSITTKDQFSFSITSPLKVASKIASGLKVAEANKLSTILIVSILDENPKRAEDILNGILLVYNKNAIDQYNLLAANTQNFINNRLISVEKELLDIENKLQKYKSSNGAIDVGTQGKLYLENVSVNDQKIGEINMQLSVLNQVENYVRSRDLTGGIVPSTAGINDPGLTQMVKDIYELQLNAESLRKTTGENNPAMVAYVDQINKIKPQILQNLRNQRNSLSASRNNLSGTTSSYSSALQSMPETERNLVDIQRQQQIKSGIYTFLLQKKEETALSYIANGSDSQIVSKAESSDFPVSPKRKMIYLAAIFGAGILGIGFVTAKDKMRRNVMFQHEIQSLTKLPVIAEISTNSSAKQIVIGSNQRTLIAEQFRSLRTTLHYIGIGKQNKRLMITSAISGEGKSFVASNLAISLGMTGKKVALLDFDLNNPSLHHKFGVKQRTGISEFLQGEASLNSIVANSTVNENLSLFLTGKLPVDPAELILNGKVEELFTELSKQFDFLIIDVPPIGPVSDAYSIAPLCDATLFVIRHAYTPKVFIERIDENIKLNNLPNPAIVFNAVSQRGFGNNNYGYGYGSGMIYGGRYDQKLIE